MEDIHSQGNYLYVIKETKTPPKTSLSHESRYVSAKKPTNQKPLTKPHPYEYIFCISVVGF